MSALLEQTSAVRTTRRTLGDVGVQVCRGMARAWIQAEVAFARMYDRSLQRLRLEDLDVHMLQDIGLTREAAQREANRPFGNRGGWQPVRPACD